jgi:hypothetical protein
MLTRDQLQGAASDTGFSADSLGKVWMLVRLLNAIVAHPFLRTRVALKGGTALNLFVFDVPRLSVDIDVDYVGGDSLGHADGLSFGHIPPGDGGGAALEVQGHVDVGGVAGGGGLGALLQERAAQRVDVDDGGGVAARPRLAGGAAQGLAALHREEVVDASDGGVAAGVEPGVARGEGAGLVERLSNWLALLTEEEVAWTRRVCGRR